jgi:hypothetical protein
LFQEFVGRGREGDQKEERIGSTTNEDEAHQKEERNIITMMSVPYIGNIR